MHCAIGTMLFVKDPSWKYEQESRIIVYGQADKYLRIQPAALTRIILGCRPSPGVASMVDGLLAERSARGHPPVQVYQATQHHSKYRLVIRERVV